ncbi:MAG: DivIVA domain-containing protein [Actinobacteria bacterium]|nr:DivIVA domain-containing protein [Actinomycetota bacterium]
MESLLLYGLLAVVAVAALYGLAVLVLPGGEQLAPPAPDIQLWALAEAPLEPGDVENVRLPVGLRGYRFAETDLLLDRLTEELRDRDAQIAELRTRLGLVGVEFDEDAYRPPAARAESPEPTETPGYSRADASSDRLAAGGDRPIATGEPDRPVDGD